MTIDIVWLILIGGYVQDAVDLVTEHVDKARIGTLTIMFTAILAI